MRQNDHGGSAVELADLVGVLPVLAVAYGVVMGGVALVAGWQLLSTTAPNSKGRRLVVPHGGGTAQNAADSSSIARGVA